MEVIALQAISKQSFSVVLGNILYDLDVLETNGCMSMDVTRAGVSIVSGQRVVTGQPVIPYLQLEEGEGNFLFLTENDELPFYQQFGLTQQLLYLSQEELAAVRAP